MKVLPHFNKSTNFNLLSGILLLFSIKRQYCQGFWLNPRNLYMEKWSLNKYHSFSMENKENIDKTSMRLGIRVFPTILGASRNDEEFENDINPANYEMKKEKVKLPNDTLAEVITTRPLSTIKSSEANGSAERPTLVFIHGSFHAAWCWAENYLPFFASNGYRSTALSLRGTNGTFAGKNVKKVKIMDHVDDIDAFLQYVESSNENSMKPILIAHSFGGLAVMKYLETKCQNTSPSDLLTGVVLFCSVPPSGNGKMTLRFLMRSIRNSWKIFAGFAFKKCINDADLCRTLFFATKDDPSGGIEDKDLVRYQYYFERDTVATIDLGDLSKHLPSLNTNSDGVAYFAINHEQLPTLIVGASDDFIVDYEGVVETSKYFGVQPITVNSPHDVMLGPLWRSGANLLKQWLMKI